MAKLSDFNDDVRDTNNGLNRVEDKLKALDKAPRDSKTLDTIKGLLDDTKGIEKLFDKVQKEGEDLINDGDQLGSDTRNIHDTLDNLGDRLGNIRDVLEGKADDLKNAGAAVGEFADMIKVCSNFTKNFLLIKFFFKKSPIYIALLKYEKKNFGS